MPHQDMPMDVVSRLSHRPLDVLWSVIKIIIRDPPKPSEVNFQNRASSLGILGRLPVELLHEVLKNLDFQSIIRFSSVSIQGKCVSSSLSAYRDTMNHAPDALSALSQTKLLHLHSASQLHNALRSERCATCPEYGVCLFLPTCERCCLQCLGLNPTRRVITVWDAIETFALSPEMAKQLPGTFSYPVIDDDQLGHYPPPNPRELVSISAAKDVLVSIHGSAENAIEAIRRRKSYEQNAGEVSRLRALLSDSTGVNTLMLPYYGNAGPPVNWSSWAVILFPSFSPPDIVEHGVWCKGCAYIFNKDLWLPDHSIPNIVPTGWSPNHFLCGMLSRAYSRTGLSAHIPHCAGAQQLLIDQAAPKA
ncbi:F-box domain-containing protein [Nemania sp. FL0916]|nr:F-box domain-containing protein [Nemania sp. FL0916]